jgi:hypothetical protein
MKNIYCGDSNNHMRPWFWNQENKCFPLGLQVHDIWKLDVFLPFIKKVIISFVR